MYALLYKSEIIRCYVKQNETSDKCTLSFSTGFQLRTKCNRTNYSCFTFSRKLSRGKNEKTKINRYTPYVLFEYVKMYPKTLYEAVKRVEYFWKIRLVACIVPNDWSKLRTRKKRSSSVREKFIKGIGKWKENSNRIVTAVTVIWKTRDG